MINRATLLGAVMALALAGCGGSGSRATDSGGITLMDSGTDTDGSTTMDSGTVDSGTVDSGTVDSGTVDSGTVDSGTVDSGTVDSGTATGPCADAPPAVPAAALPRCAAATLTCLMGCADAACQQTCIDGDTTPADTTTGLDCNTCLNAQSIQCADANGCHAQYAAINCCIEAHSCADQACVNTSCGTELGAFNTCANGTGSACQSALLSCFP